MDELVSALATLPAEQRAVIVLRHLFDYAPGEIASLLELPRGTVNSRLRRGLDALAERLQEDERAGRGASVASTHAPPAQSSDSEGESAHSRGARHQ